MDSISFLTTCSVGGFVCCFFSTSDCFLWLDPDPKLIYCTNITITGRLGHLTLWYFKRGGGGGGVQLQAASGGALEDNVVPHTAHKTVQPLMPYEDCYRHTRRTL